MVKNPSSRHFTSSPIFLTVAKTSVPNYGPCLHKGAMMRAPHHHADHFRSICQLTHLLHNCLLLMEPHSSLLFYYHGINHQETWINLTSAFKIPRAAQQSLCFHMRALWRLLLHVVGQLIDRGELSSPQRLLPTISSLHFCSRGSESLLSGWTCGHLNCTLSFSMTALYSHIPLLTKTTRI